MNDIIQAHNEKKHEGLELEHSDSCELCKKYIDDVKNKKFESVNDLSIDVNDSIKAKSVFG